MEKRPSVLLISVDALMPRFVFEAEKHGVRLENIRSCFIKNGAFAEMKSVFPAFTYACHQTMVTGVYPDCHGTVNNIVFDPVGLHNDAWHWFVSDRVENLWERASREGYLTASMAFPTSVGAKGDYIAPEFWYDGTELDSRLIDALSRPQGLIAEMEKEIGQYPGGLDLTPDGDRRRYLGGRWLLERKLGQERPFFLSVYFASFDEMAHIYGVYSPEAAKALEALDGYVGELMDAARKIAGDNLVVCLVSDHGTLDNTHNIRPNTLLRERGLITVEGGRVTGWRAWCQRSGGTAEVRLCDPEDGEARRLTEKILRELEADPDSGIARVLTGREAREERHGFPQCDFALIAKRGYEFRDDTTGDYLTDRVTQRAQHGYDEDYEEMLAFFGITGRGVPVGRDLGRVRLIDVAPTLAGAMGFELKDAQGKRLL